MAATGFTSKQVTAITGVTNRQLVYWRKTGLVIPSRQTEGGHVRYSFSDLIALKTAMQLIDAGVSVQRMRKALRALVQFLPQICKPLSELHIVATGDVILVLHSDSDFEALSGQEWIFPLATLQQDIERYTDIREEHLPVQGKLFAKDQEDHEASYYQPMDKWQTVPKRGAANKQNQGANTAPFFMG